MEEALYSLLGFFNTDLVRSDKEGDFLTSPEVSKYFGKILRNWINSKSNIKNIIEIGSGTGSLIEQIGIKEITAVELSSTARMTLHKDIDHFRFSRLVGEKIYTVMLASERT